jgi:hypothetical protein
MKKHRTKVPDFSSAPKNQPRVAGVKPALDAKAAPPKAPIAVKVKPQATSAKSGRRGG